MRQLAFRCALSAMAPAVVVGASPARAEAPVVKRLQSGAYTKVLEDTVAMVGDHHAQSLAAKRGLQIMNVTWEDTGRYKGSSVGPNISDMTIQVQDKGVNGQDRLYLMPVIRFPNFDDKSADVPLDRFHLLVGNERGDELRKVTLEDFLGNIREYLHDPRSWKGERQSLLAPRDTHALVSAQAAFLPIPKSGEAKFNPVLFNYQSMKDDPAVLTILATREGTSVTIIDNVRDGFSSGGVWGQRLFFNADGERASLTGKRMSDVRLGVDVPGGPSASAAGQEGMNMVLLIQVPLKQKNPMRFEEESLAFAADLVAPSAVARSGSSDVENAVIGHGALEGPFTEIAGLDVERDPQFPVRVTVQFYKATSNGIVSDKDLDDIKGQIDKVYDDADYVGSLVTGGETGRPTEYDGPKQEPLGWWDVFWQRHEQNTGLTREQIMWARKVLFRPGWVPVPWWQGPLRIED
ncbi:MAG: hypothetical protein IT385_11595 [Deltaproteobacteria bacterium]|nr:hypothetical protein [Deltaproteobacteria bacterium]